MTLATLQGSAGKEGGLRGPARWLRDACGVEMHVRGRVGLPGRGEGGREHGKAVHGEAASAGKDTD